MPDDESSILSGPINSPRDEQEAVFINCPFDADFAPLFEALVFAIVACKFEPRSALESANVSEPRMERITRAIFTSRYSIHDLSRCRGEGEERLARFNMPLELGIAMACRYLTRGAPHEHDWLLLVPEGHVYVKVVSDLAGFDPLKHDGSERTVVQSVMLWLTMRRGVSPSLPTPKSVLDALPKFRAELAQLKAEWGPEPPWPLLVEAAKRTVPSPTSTFP